MSANVCTWKRGGGTMRSAQKMPMEGRIAGKRYRIGRLLRRAASGDVYACQDIAEKNPRLAIRISPVSEVKEASEYLGRRIVLLQKLQHPQIEKILDFGSMTEKGELFLVSGCTEGADFYSGTENCDPPVILSLLTDILRVLRYLHTRGLIHGNLTPESVLLFKNSEGRRIPFLRDFSLQRCADKPGGFYNTESICYTAPELLLEGREGKEMDFYAAGILLYQALTRRLPFENGDPDFVVQKQIQGNIDLSPIERLDGGESVAPVLERLLEKDPKKRIRSVDEALAFLPRKTRHDFDLPDEKAGSFSAAPFVGREKEMRLLLKRARQVKENGRGWTVFIAGEAGSGKTRCMDELRGWAAVNGWRIAEGVCSACEESPYSPYRQILGEGEFFGKENDLCFEDISLVAESDSFGYGFASGRFQNRLTRELIRHLSARPTLLLLHDIHRATRETCVILEYLCSDIRAHPILVCAGFRADEISGNVIRGVIDGVRRGERGEVVSLDPLTKNGVRQMIAGLTGIGKHQDALCDWMFRTVGGNPFFLEELLKQLADRGILKNQSGCWKFTMPLMTKPEIPAGIGAILRKRMAQLSPPAMETLEWLSLLRRAAPRKYTEFLSISDYETNEASLAELDRCRLLRVESPEGGEVVAPGYELIAEVAREMIPQERKNKMYRKIAGLLEKESGRSCMYEAALHYIESPPDDRSVRCALTAITGFQAIFAHENALRCFEYVSKYKNRLATKEFLQAMIAVCDSMLALGEARQAIQMINSALRSVSGIEPELKARLNLCLAAAYRHAGDWRRQESISRAGLGTLCASSAAARFTETALWTERAFSAIMCSRAPDALRYLDRAMEACPDKNSPELIGTIQNLYAVLYCDGGEFKKAAAAGKKAVAVLEHSGEHIQKCFALSMLGLTQMKHGRFAAALRLHLRAAALGKKSRSIVPYSWASGKLSECLCRIGRIRKSFDAMNYAAAAAKESNNPVIIRACDAIAAEINLAACNYRETRRILKTLEDGEKYDFSDFIARRSGYVSAELNFSLGDFTNALDDIRKLRKRKTAKAPLYEYELAEALCERILFERDEDAGALERLLMLKKNVAGKRRPYQRCIIKLHICEILIRLKRPEEAESYARNALRLAKGMRSAALECRAHLMLGISRSPLQRASFSDKSAFVDICVADRAICSLKTCLDLADTSGSMECRWRALAELSSIYRYYKNFELCFRCARQAQETLVQLEERTPSDMLDSFHGVFNRGRIKFELEHLIETGWPICRDPRSIEGSTGAIAGILLRMTAMVNSVREIAPLLDGLLVLALSAIAARRGLIFLADETSGKLGQAGGRCAEIGDDVYADDISLGVLESVFHNGKPLVSADAGSDPRIIKNEFTDPPGKLLCIPLKTPERAIGVFYADSFKPVNTISVEEIDFAEVFCSLTALAIDNIQTHRKLTQEDVKPGFLKETPDPFPEIIGAGAAIRLLKDRIGLVAASPLDVLITGESGSGKELVARAISSGDRRRNGKFVPVDCGALVDGVAEAELFGFRKGAFTGADENRAGLFEAAGGGVLFLDEISNMPMRIQVKLLRALQEREIRRIGETAPRKIEIRVVAASNKDLADEMENGRFCSDLYYRIKGMEINTPPLRERAEDIPLLIERFLQRIFDQEKGETRRFSPEAMEMLRQYSYPGNIRELNNIVMTAYYMSYDHIIEAGALPREVRIRSAAGSAANPAADNLYRKILAGGGGFEDLVKKPYLARRIEASVVRGVIRLALTDSSGVYRNAFALLRMPKNQYAATMQFLKRHDCYLDFLPFRRDCE